MIFTIKDTDNKHTSNIPMFSRVGKQTNSIYIAFSQDRPHFDTYTKDDEDDIFSVKVNAADVHFLY